MVTSDVHRASFAVTRRCCAEEWRHGELKRLEMRHFFARVARRDDDGGVTHAEDARGRNFGRIRARGREVRRARDARRRGLRA
jgi:hypothetical protein